MDIKQNRLDREFLRHQDEYEQKALEVLRSAWYVLGKEVRAFEEEFAQYMGAKHCIGVASGLDALWIAMHLLGIGQGDEVLVPGNTFIASVMGVSRNGATPVFVEPNEYDTLDAAKLEEKLTPRTKAVMVVHLYGQTCDMEQICAFTKKHGLKLIEDCAQSQGAKWNGRYTGTFGDTGCFSFFPTKNLGCFGDGGGILTDDSDLAEKIRMFRNYGSSQKYVNPMEGTNSRLDEIQAGLLRIKLKYLKALNEERQEAAAQYLSQIRNPLIQLPKIVPGGESVWHQFVIHVKNRDGLAAYLSKNGVQTLIHYPIPPHMQEVYQYLNVPQGSLPITEQAAREVLSLPMYNGITAQEITAVAELLNAWKGEDDA